jgi:hypothetical protein
MPTAPPTIGILSPFILDSICTPSTKKPAAKPIKLDAVVIFSNRLCVFICSVIPVRHLQVASIRLRQSPSSSVTVL